MKAPDLADNSGNMTHRSRDAAVLDFVFTGVGAFCLSAGFRMLTGNPDMASSLWLANGFVLGMLLAAPRSRWLVLLLVSAMAGAGSAFLLGSSVADLPWVALFNAVEVLLAAALLAGTVRSAAELAMLGNFLRFLLVAVLLAPALLAMAFGMFDLLSGRPPAITMMKRIFISHALGMAVMTPLVLALRSGELRQYLARGTIVESLLTQLLVAAVCVLVFFQTTIPLLFLIFPPMMQVAYRGGFVGTAIALLLVVVIGALATVTGHGPIQALEASGRFLDYPLASDGLIVLQVFVASLLLSLFPMIVALAEGRRAHRATEELQNRMRLLMDHSSDVVILTDLDGQRLYVSPAVREVTGYEADQFLGLTWRDYVHEADSHEVGARIEEARATRGSRVISFRVKHAAGAEVWVEANMKYFRDRTFVLMQSEKDSGIQRNCGPDGDEGFVITMRDVTASRRAEMELERANAELASLARKDSLTGLANRRSFDEVLQTAWSEALAGGWPLAVLMIDVDHFKQFNDCYGHQRGDLCLRDVAVAIISGLFHPDDMAARYGGEEFAVILPRTSIDHAAQVAERIRHAVHDLRRPHVASPLGSLTISVGVAAALPVRHGDPLAVVRAADEALYTSKHEGRNRTTLLDVSWPDPASAPAGSTPAADQT
jgi:diguanylate cyclase (GGDEF)-like protein/PAS domain S-box-containing protein